MFLFKEMDFTIFLRFLTIIVLKSHTEFIFFSTLQHITCLFTGMLYRLVCCCVLLYYLHVLNAKKIYSASYDFIISYFSYSFFFHYLFSYYHDCCYHCYYHNWFCLLPNRKHLLLQFFKILKKNKIQVYVHLL